jgi:predicted RNase H-like HicB family nuclease
LGFIRFFRKEVVLFFCLIFLIQSDFLHVILLTYLTDWRIIFMLANYIDAAMEQAVYDIIEDEGTYFGQIPGFQGVWARATTLEGCRRSLRETLGDWIALRLRLNLAVPIIADIDLNHLNHPYEAQYA